MPLKKIVLIVLSLFVSGVSFSQDKTIYTKDEILKKANKCVEDYLLKCFSKADYDAYFKINESSSNLELNIPLNELNNTGIAKNWIRKIKVLVDINIGNRHDAYEFEVRKDFTVIENMSYRNKGEENITMQFFNSLKAFIDLKNSNKILPADSVFRFVSITYPDKKWGTPNIKRNSFPPYQYYYEVMQDSCNSCKRIYIHLQELIELGKNKVEMIPIK